MGFTNSEIGARMFLAESTVKSHLSSSYSKLGVRSRSEAVSLLLDRISRSPPASAEYCRRRFRRMYGAASDPERRMTLAQLEPLAQDHS